jgi:hypothetical protein
MKAPLAYLGHWRDKEVSRLTLLAQKTENGYEFEYHIAEDLGTASGNHEVASFFGSIVPAIEKEFSKQFSKPSE